MSFLLEVASAAAPPVAFVFNETHNANAFVFRKCSLCFSFLASYSNTDWQSAKPSEVNLVKHIKEDLFKVLQASWKSYESYCVFKI